MKWMLRIPGAVLDEVRSDLARPHPFAAERVGFLFTRIGNRNGSEVLVLVAEYEALRDGDYVEDETVGARYGVDVHRRLLQRALSEKVGVFHVHEHSHQGTPHFSGVDVATTHGMVPSLRVLCPEQAHGALLLSRDSLNALCWLPGSSGPERSGRLVTVGRPYGIFSVEAPRAKRLPLKTELPRSSAS